MKTPILFDAQAIKSDVKPVFTRGVYDVFVGATEEDKFPLYMVINKNTGVVEFSHEVQPVVTEWLDHFVKDKEGNGQLELGLKN